MKISSEIKASEQPKRVLVPAMRPRSLAMVLEQVQASSPRTDSLIRLPFILKKGLLQDWEAFRKQYLTLLGDLQKQYKFDYDAEVESDFLSSFWLL